MILLYFYLLINYVIKISNFFGFFFFSCITFLELSQLIILSHFFGYRCCYCKAFFWSWKKKEFLFFMFICFVSIVFFFFWFAYYLQPLSIWKNIMFCFICLLCFLLNYWNSSSFLKLPNFLVLKTTECRR